MWGFWTGFRVGLAITLFAGAVNYVAADSFNPPSGGGGFVPPVAVTGPPGNGTYAGAVSPLTITRSNQSFDTNLTLLTPATLTGGFNGNAVSNLDIYSDTAGATTAIRLFTNQQSPAVPYTWFTPGGMYTTVNIFLCTNRTGSTGLGLTQPVVCPTASPGSTGGALEVVNDTVGPAADFGIIADDAQPGVFNTDWRDGNSVIVSGISSDGSHGFGLTHFGAANAWSNLDTWIGRGNGAAFLQVGGPDSFSPSAQTFASPSVVAPVTQLQGLASAAGQNVLNYRNNIQGGVPPSIVVGMTVTDSTNAVIPAATTVTAINYGARTFTLSANITGIGVQLNDVLRFSAPNKSGADLTIQAGKGTGTGAPGVLRLVYAPASTTNDTQNTNKNAIIIGQNGAAPVQIDSGGLSVPQLTFLPNSGVSTSLGAANGGSALIVFSGAAQTHSFNNGYFELANGGYIGWSNTSGNAVTTIDVSIGRVSAGLMQILTSGAACCGSLELAASISAGAAPTITTGSCSGSSWVGGMTVGQFTAAACAAGTYVMSGLQAAPNGWFCTGTDRNTGAALPKTASTTTSCTLKATTAASDVVDVMAYGY